MLECLPRPLDDRSGEEGEPREERRERGRGQDNGGRQRVADGRTSLLDLLQIKTRALVLVSIEKFYL